MKRTRLNVLLLAVVAGGAPLALAPSPAMAGVGDGGGEGGTCCASWKTFCYVDVEGEIYVVPDSYFVEPGEECDANEE
ncbi:MAG TPA: hypothetical protein VHG08_11705 [Longimicrobium sp.]|nr:hypothetical protein [Longimicrobium sp.]